MSTCFFFLTLAFLPLQIVLGKHKLTNGCFLGTISVEKKPRPELLKGGTERFLYGVGTLEVFEKCYIHFGKLNFRQNWLQREVSQSLTTAVVFGVAVLSMMTGFLCGWVLAMSRYPYIVM